MSAVDLFAPFTREVWVLTAAADGRRGGLITTAVTQASIVPQLERVLVGIAKQHNTWGLIEASGAFALHLLGEDHIEWVWRFGLRSGRDVDKLAGLATTTGTTGSPLLTDALAWMDCRVEARMDTGDRTVYLAEVVSARLLRGDPYLTARRMVQLAPPERKKELADQMDRDIAVDAAAIRAWRASHHDKS